MGSIGKRVLVAMSGGVDSSVAAAVLKERGYDVIGVTMQLWDNSAEKSSGSCCSIEDIHDARRVAYQLDIPHYVVNLKEAFSRHVIDYFVNSYLKGETPNPCLKCNEHLKFDILLRKACELEADYLATGHYARILNDGEGSYHLLKGVDTSKDQSYFLFTLGQKELKRLLFPLGDITKAEVRDIAGKKGLKVADKGESQEICFVPDGDYSAFLSARTDDFTSGEIVDADGNVLGRHEGIHRFTVGQRRGIGISANKPLYVTAIDKGAGRITVGSKEELLSNGLEAQFVNLVNPEEGFPDRAVCKIRYRHPGAESSVVFEDGLLRIYFKEPQGAVAPGQAAVLYNGDEVVGGGWIKRVIKRVFV